MALNDRNQNKLVDTGLLAAGGIALYFWLKNRITVAQKDGAEASLVDSEVAQQAQQLRAAFNPSGSSWLIQTDGTKTATVLKIASEIKDFSGVAKVYNNLYASNLSDDLTNELSASELATFMARAKGSQKAAKLAPLFKINIGDEVATNPRKGFPYVSFYPKPTGDIKFVAKHTKPGAFAGKVAKRTIGTFKVNGGKVEKREMYGLINIPLKDAKPTTIYWVFGADLKKLVR